MPAIIADRVCAEAPDGVVVFLIGMRINCFWKVWAWLPLLAAMPRMLQELACHPELGLLSARSHFGLRNQMVVQYWRSAEHLTAYARARDSAHLPAWQAFNRAVGTNGTVGIWHETYVVPPGNTETIYVNMPPHGLGLTSPLHPATGPRTTAAGRLNATSPRTPSR